MNKIAFLRIYNGRLWLYNRGAISLVGDFAAYGTGASITKNADHLLLTLSSATGWIYGTSPIDLTNIDILYFYGSTNHLTAAVNFAVHTNYTSTTNTGAVTIPNSGADGLVALSVASLSGNYYVRFGRFGSAISATARCYEMYGER